MENDKKLLKDKILVCERDSDGNITCNVEPRKPCKTVKETGFGIHGPILNIKRVCIIKRPKDIVKAY